MDESSKNTNKPNRKRKVRPPRSRFKKPSAREETFKKKYLEFIKRQDQDNVSKLTPASSSNIKCDSSIPGLNLKFMTRIHEQSKKSKFKESRFSQAVSTQIKHWGEIYDKKPVNNYYSSPSPSIDDLKKINKFKVNHALVSTLSSYFNFSNKVGEGSKSDPKNVEEKDYDFLIEPENNLSNVAKFKKRLAIEEILKSKVLCRPTTEQGESNKQVKKRIDNFFHEESLCTEHDDYFNRNENLLNDYNNSLAIDSMKMSWDNSDENTLIRFFDPATLISNRLNVIQTSKVNKKIFDKIRLKSSRYYDTRILNLLERAKKVSKSNFTHFQVDRKRRHSISPNKNDTTSFKKSKKDDEIIKDRNKEKLSNEKCTSTKTNHCDSKKNREKVKLKAYEDLKKRSQTSKNHNDSNSSCKKSTASSSGSREKVKNSQGNKERVTSRSRNKDFLSSLANQTEIKKSMEVLYFSLKGGESSHTATSTSSQQQVSPFSLSFVSQLQGIGNKSQQQKGKTESSYSLSISESKGHGHREEITADKSISLNENLLHHYNNEVKELIEGINQNSKDQNASTPTKRKEKKKKKKKKKSKSKEKESRESNTNNKSNIKICEDEKSKQNSDTKNYLPKSSNDKLFVKKLVYPYPIWYPHSTPIPTYRNIFANEQSASNTNFYNKIRLIDSDSDYTNCQPKIISFSRKKREIVKSTKKGSSDSKMLNNTNTTSQIKDIKADQLGESIKSFPLKYTSVEILERKNQQPVPERSANIDLLRKKLLNQQVIQSQRNPTKVKSAFLAQQQFNSSTPKRVFNSPLVNNLKEYIGKSSDINNLHLNSIVGKLSSAEPNNIVNSDSPFKTILKTQESYLSPSKSNIKKESPSKSVKIHISPPEKDSHKNNNLLQVNRFTNKRRYQASDRLYLNKLVPKLTKETSNIKKKYRYCMRTGPIDQYKRILNLLHHKRELEYNIKKASVDEVIFKDYNLLDTLNSIVETEDMQILENGLDLDLENTINEDEEMVDVNKKPKDTVLDKKNQLESNISKSHKVKRKFPTTIDKIRRNNNTNVSKRILDKYRKYAKKKSAEYVRVKPLRQKILRRLRGENKSIPTPNEEYVFPNSIPMTSENAHETLQKRLCLPIALAGFTHVTPPALNALTLATEFFYKKISSRLHQIVEEEMCSYDHGFPDAIERAMVEYGFGGARNIVQVCENFKDDAEDKLNRRCVLLTKKYFDLTANENLIEISSPTKKEPSVSPSKNKQQQKDDANSDDKKLKVINQQSVKSSPKGSKSTLNSKDIILDEGKTKNLSSHGIFSFP